MDALSAYSSSVSCFLTSCLQESICVQLFEPQIPMNSYAYHMTYGYQRTVLGTSLITFVSGIFYPVSRHHEIRSDRIPDHGDRMLVEVEEQNSIPRSQALSELTQSLRERTSDSPLTAAIHGGLHLQSISGEGRRVAQEY